MQPDERLAAPTVEELFKAGSHYGHLKRNWHPKYARYLYGARAGLHIINLDVSQTCLAKAMEYCYTVSKAKGRILFVGTKNVAGAIVRAQADRCGMPYIDRRWPGGLMTNWKTVRGSIRKLEDLETKLAPAREKTMTKKERLMLQRQYDRLLRVFSGVRKLRGLPEAVMVVDATEEHIAVVEARKVGLPVIAMIDSDTNPSDIEVPIPVNDDSRSSIELVLTSLADACLAGSAGHKTDEAPQSAPEVTVVGAQAQAQTEAPAAPVAAAADEARPS